MAHPDSIKDSKFVWRCCGQLDLGGGTVRGAICRYFASRGKVVGKVAKFPHIDDYRECIRDMDEKQAITMRYIIMEIRNHYATLHDLIIKNIDRIKTPRSNNSITMY